MADLEAKIDGLEVVVRLTGDTELPDGVHRALDQLARALAAADPRPPEEVQGFGLRIGSLGMTSMRTTDPSQECIGFHANPDGSECTWFTTSCATHVVKSCTIFSIRKD